MGHIFGPVPSRRLGLSLGVDVVPHKTCTLSCIYCQVGETPEPTLVRREYIPVEEIRREIREKLEKGPAPDWVTFSGSGEPTLHSGIGRIIRDIKSITDIPICVITNGTLLWIPEVREDILEADAVMPSLDTAVEETFHTINRPHHDLKIETIIDGLVAFRHQYRGKLWLEILLVNTINDIPEELNALVHAVERIAPDSVQLNTVVRPPADRSAKPLTRERLEEIRDMFGAKAEIIIPPQKTSNVSESVGIDDVREYLKRRPGSIEDISSALRVEKGKVEDIIGKLSQADEVRLNEFFGKQFWELA